MEVTKKGLRLRLGGTVAPTNREHTDKHTKSNTKFFPNLFQKKSYPKKKSYTKTSEERKKNCFFLKLCCY